MKKKCIAIFLVSLVLLTTGCAMNTTEHAFSNWDDQVHEDMTGTENVWSYTLTTTSHSLEHYDEEGRLLVTGRYELPVMQVFHADGTPYTEQTESLTPAMQVAERVNGEECGAEGYCYTDAVQAVFWNNSHIACVTLRSDSFTGGAHHIRSRSALTFDMRTGEEITINDMVDDYAGLRDAVALEILGQIADGKYVKYYHGELLFEDYEETIPEWMTRAVFFGKESMTVVFGVYDIADYDAGEQAFMIPYTLIEPYLNQYGKTVLEIG